MKPKFIMSSGTGWSATTPLWYTLQLDNQYMHTGLNKESEYIKKLLQNPTERFSGVVERIRKKSRWRSREEHKVRKEQTINKNLFLNQEDKDAFLKAPYTIEKYITYYKKLWESLQENNCSYQAVGDFSNANYSIPEEFCHELVGKLSEEFDVKVLMIVRDPIRRLWSEIGGFWGQKSTRQWENEKEVIECLYDRITRRSLSLDYVQVIEKWERVCPIHVVIMEQLWEGDEQEREKQRLSDFLDYDIKKIHENVYSPDRGPNAPHYEGLPDQWTSDKYWLQDELYNRVKPLFHVYQQWVDKYGSLPLYWGKPYNYEV